MKYVEVHQLKSIREKTLLGVRLFAEISGISPSGVQSIESGKSTQTNKIKKYLKGLNIAYRNIGVEVEYSLILKAKKTP